MQQADSTEEASLKYSGSSAFIFILFLFHVLYFRPDSRDFRKELIHTIKVQNYEQVTTESNYWGTIQKVHEVVRNKNGRCLIADPCPHYRYHSPAEEQRHIKARKCCTEQVQNTAGTTNDLV